MLAGLKASELSSLHGLKLCYLKGIQLLASKHLRHDHSSLPHLHQLWLAGILEAAHGANRLVN